MQTRKLGQKIVLIISYICYTAGLIAMLYGGYYALEYNTSNPIFSSMIAATVFFFSCGIVLQILGSGNLPSLKIETKTGNKD